MVADIFIGFLLPNATYPEEEATHQVILIKGAGNVTEQEIIVVLNLVQTVPPGTSFDIATPSDINNDHDLLLTGGRGDNSVQVSFQPDVNEITVQINIFGDELLENTEAAQLTLEIPTEKDAGVAPPRFEILPEFPTFFIIISDDDRKSLDFTVLNDHLNMHIYYNLYTILSIA